MNIFKEVSEFCEANHYVDVADKVPIFLCSIGTHIFNGLNKCGLCPHIPDDKGNWAIDHCILRHDKPPLYTPMSHVADTRLHIIMKGIKGSGKSILLHLFLAKNTGLLYHPNAHDLGLGFRTDMGPNSITEAGMFGSVNEDKEIVGMPLAREMCGGFLGFEEMSTLLDAAKKDHSTDITNQLLTSTDNGRVKKVMKSGWVEYLTRFTVWGGTQPARFDMESGLDRRFFIIDIAMGEEKQRAYKEAQIKQSSMSAADRLPLVDKTREIQEWFVRRATEVISNPPTGVVFSEELNDWIRKDTVHSHEADLFRRLALGYTVLQEKYMGGQALIVNMTPFLRELLDASLIMRRKVMDGDVELIKHNLWGEEMSRRDLNKYVASAITNRDYQAAKRWIDENLSTKDWFTENRDTSKKGSGRRGVKVFIGISLVNPENPQKIIWGEASAK